MVANTLVFPCQWPLKGRSLSKTRKQRTPSFPHLVRVRRGVERVDKESWRLEFVDGDRTKQITDGEGTHHRSTIGDDA
jgi:hypothetical protein